MVPIFLALHAYALRNATAWGAPKAVNSYLVGDKSSSLL